MSYIRRLIGRVWELLKGIKTGRKAMMQLLQVLLNTRQTILSHGNDMNSIKAVKVKRKLKLNHRKQDKFNSGIEVLRENKFLFYVQNTPGNVLNQAWDTLHNIWHRSWPKSTCRNIVLIIDVNMFFVKRP